MPASLEQLAQKLFAETDGNKFDRLKNKLLRGFAGSARHELLKLFMQYAQSGPLLHWRSFLLTDIIELVEEGEDQWKPFFGQALSKPGLRYWSIDGLLKTAGREAYGQLVAIATDQNLPTEDRAKAVKSLALHSNQIFDRGLPDDPGHWGESDLRIGELLAWQAAGFNQGEGHAKPKVYPALLNPQTPLERAAAKLESKLKVLRDDRQDPAVRTNWLTTAREEDMAAILQQWTLPDTYRLFLERFSPLNVQVSNREFSGSGLYLYGASELIGAQEGYAWNSAAGEHFSDWPAAYVVIADEGGDPYCLDTGAIQNGDAPVYSSMHGAGAWNFELYTGSFLEFLKRLSKR